MTAVRVVESLAGLRTYLQTAVPEPGPSIGFVPTMGALHAGHLSLLKRARQENDWVVASIFVNPLQFGSQEDWQRYPRTLAADQALCADAGVDLLFLPQAATFLGDTATTRIEPAPALLQVLCGPRRPGHFAGVATIVIKFLNAIQPQRLYLGQKDAQQLAILRRVIADLSLPVTVVACPTVREPDGLACSSRNTYLSPAGRTQATVLYRALQAGAAAFQGGERQSQHLIDRVQTVLTTVPDVVVEYVDLVDPARLLPLDRVETSGLLAAAIRLEDTRLIDNLLLRQRRPIIAIDGPAGAGKSTLARQLAHHLGLCYLDTGAMYRAVTWKLLATDTVLTDAVAVAEQVSRYRLDITLDPDPSQPLQVRLDDQDVTPFIRSPQVTESVALVAAQPAVRTALVQVQQHLGQTGGLVAEGRDIGTVVFPDAEIKVFLTASVEERARRRCLDLQDQGETPTLEAVAQAIRDRDTQDSQRPVAPLRQAYDALLIDTSGRPIDNLLRQITELVHERCPGLKG
ncbi:MAG: bifunctional pantoate--beta-alanine ligase/(d)CMP kinase [Gloeomargaritaceae cyanobacterium C42_A2020_066]|nr:bifunctional pantoate--beta-alanine ligase/(d)CMP kinase [Gloeomargaritaceae cyanobacterium C42_A2020_066]